VNKENIFEELDRMKYLIKAKSGTVISEQDAGSVAGFATAGALYGAGMGAGVFSVPGAIIGGAVGAIIGLLQNSTNSNGAKKILQACSDKKTVGPASQSRQQLNAIADALNAAIEGTGTDEKAIKANLQKITTIPDLCAMSNIYQTRHGESLWDALDGDIDEQSEWKNYVYLPLLDAYENSVELGKKVAAAPKAGATAAGATSERQKVINSTFCNVRGGKITSGYYKDQPWDTYKTKFSVTDAEVKAAKQSCPSGQTGSKVGGGSSRISSGGSGQVVNDRFAKSTQSLGIQGGKMDVQTLQSILKTLEGGQSTPAVAATATQGTPDLAQLTSALNQLNA
jgi:hypothetical protein